MQRALHSTSPTYQPIAKDFDILVERVNEMTADTRARDPRIGTALSGVVVLNG